MSKQTISDIDTQWNHQKTEISMAKDTNQNSEQQNTKIDSTSGSTWAKFKNRCQNPDSRAAGVGRVGPGHTPLGLSRE